MIPEDYLSLIPQQHRGAVLFMQWMRSILENATDTNNFIKELPSHFDIDTAVGKQLDTIGLWVGVGRSLLIPITGVYFSWRGNIANGWRSGVWRGEFDPESGLTDLDDNNYRILIKTKIAYNYWDGTILNAYNAFKIVFGDNVVITDKQNMTMLVGIANTNVNAVLEAILIQRVLPIKPEGVGITNYVTSNRRLFGWRLDNNLIGGWREADFGKRL